MALSRVDEEVRAAIEAAGRDDVALSDKIDMLIEIAMGLQTQPKSPSDLLQAVELYEKALELCPEESDLLRARITARMGTALQTIPSGSTEYLERAEECFESAQKVLAAQGNSEELAELELNLGLVLQTLAGAGKRRITDAISAYQRALRVFDKKAHPKEFAILQNNLATAFMSMPFTDQRSKMREALAVQSFEEGLGVVNIIDHPAEYAMLQNNLGNALQYSSSSHLVANNLRALDAYEEALKVRTKDTTPLEYANTICNKANCLLNLPDDAENPELQNRGNQRLAKEHYEEARSIFQEHGDEEKVQVVTQALQDLAAEFGLGHQVSAPGADQAGAGKGAD